METGEGTQEGEAGKDVVVERRLSASASFSLFRYRHTFAVFKLPLFHFTVMCLKLFKIRVGLIYLLSPSKVQSASRRERSLS